MSATPAGSFMILAAAIIIAAIMISATLFVALGTSTVTKTTTVTTTSICDESTSNATTSTATDCLLGLTLGLRVAPTIASGENESILVSLNNDFKTTRDVNYTGLPTLPNGPALSSPQAFDYVLPLEPSCGIPSDSSYEPAFVVIYNGSGDPLQLINAPFSVTNCLTSSPDYHSFTASQTSSETVDLGGYWTSPNPSEPWINATYHQLAPGTYTVVAFDPWQQLTQMSFTVNLRDTQASPALCLKEVPYSASIVSTSNSTFDGYRVTFANGTRAFYSLYSCPVPLAPDQYSIASAIETNQRFVAAENGSQYVYVPTPESSESNATGVYGIYQFFVFSSERIYPCGGSSWTYTELREIQVLVPINPANGSLDISRIQLQAIPESELNVYLCTTTTTTA